MDADRLRTLVEGALAAQAELNAVREEADNVALRRKRAAEQVRNEVGHLRSMIGDGLVIYNDRVLRVASAVGEDGVPVVVLMPVIATIGDSPTPDATMPRASTPAAPPSPTAAAPPKSPPLSGGTTPPKKKQ